MPFATGIFLQVLGLLDKGIFLKDTEGTLRTIYWSQGEREPPNQQGLKVQSEQLCGGGGVGMLGFLNLGIPKARRFSSESETFCMEGWGFEV